MRKLIALGDVVLILVLAMTATTIPVGQHDADAQAFPGEPSFEAQGNAATLGGVLQEPAVTADADGISVEGAATAFGGALQAP